MNLAAENLLKKFSLFLNYVRPFVDITHIWHDTAALRAWRAENKLYAPEQRYGHTVDVDGSQRYDLLFPETPPQEGDRVLGKHFMSPFLKTDLEKYIPQKDSLGMVLSTKRQDCVFAALYDGLKHGYNMVAISDLIYPGGPLHEKLKDVPELTSIEILTALGLEQPS